MNAADLQAALDALPRVRLGTLPTPLQDAPTLAYELGVARLLIKRDDLTGLAFGGNKTRNLEFRMAEAVEAGADVLVFGVEIALRLEIGPGLYIPHPGGIVLGANSIGRDAT